MDPAPHYLENPPHPQLYRDIHTIQNIIDTLRENIITTTEALHRTQSQVDKMLEALVNIKQFSLHTIGPINDKSCKNKDCKAMQERLERSLHSIIDLVNHSLRNNE
jgi:hypothetical protein